MALKPRRLATLKPLPIPIDDEVYEIPPVDADLGLFLTEFSATLASAQAEEQENGKATVPLEQAERLQELAAQLNGGDTLARMLGDDNLERMRANRVPWETIQLAAQTVMTWTVAGVEAAEQYWNTGGNPKAKRPRDRQAKKPRG